MYFLDTCTCVEFIRGRMPLVMEMLKTTTPDQVKLPAIVEAELLHGAERSAQVERNRRITQEFLSAFETIPFDGVCARAYAAIKAQLERDGQIIGANDLLIAATACAHQAVLVTNNVSEFARVPGLRIESWAEVELPEA